MGSIVIDSIRGLDATAELLKLNEAFPGKLYLTGSRYFGGAELNSDWDFYTENTPEAREYLENNYWFENLANQDLWRKYTGDLNVARVYVKTFVRSAGIDIQLVRDVDMKTKAQEPLASTPIGRDLKLLKERVNDRLITSNPHPREWWNWAYKVVAGDVWCNIQEDKRDEESQL